MLYLPSELSRLKKEHFVNVFFFVLINNTIKGCGSETIKFKINPVLQIQVLFKRNMKHYVELWCISMKHKASKSLK